ncbi:MAG: efflux RND transporter periplasmic adaptor subunit [Thiomargarita sp.]|nr:efflux RND transporter periplasmic adaptor subunit [Thiomargarita sp.]
MFKRIIIKYGFIVFLLSLWIPVEAQDTNSAITRGLLVARTETTLSSQISARIEQISVKEGNRFKLNQNLIEFDCRLYQAQLNRAKAQLQAAEKTFAANLQLQGFQAISQLEVAVSQADVAKAEADVELSKVHVSLCKIKAPFNGRVIKRHVAPYASVSPGDKLLDVLDDSQLEIRLHIPSIWLSSVNIGTQFKVEIDETKRTYRAKVIRMGAKVDPVSQTLLITASIIDKDKHLLAGMSGVARFELSSRQEK